MKNLLLIFHLFISIALVGLILLQSSQGGLGRAFGGLEFHRTKRGAERLIFSLTITFTLLFLTTSILSLLVH